MRSLLDVNVLIALLDADHASHGRAVDWFRAHTPSGWASCPLTQNGCVRVMSSPGYPNALAPGAVMGRLAEATEHSSHAFWADDVSLLDRTVVDGSRVHGPRQITDVYLLALAIRHGGRFVTFDVSIAIDAVRGANRDRLVAI